MTRYVGGSERARRTAVPSGGRHYHIAQSVVATQALLEEVMGMGTLSRRLWQDEEGQDLTEYGLLLVLIALAAIATMQSLASAISNVFSNAAGSLSTS